MQQTQKQEDQERLVLYGPQARAVSQLLAHDPLIVKMSDDVGMDDNDRKLT